MRIQVLILKHLSVALDGSDGFNKLSSAAVKKDNLLPSLN